MTYIFLRVNYRSISSDKYVVLSFLDSDFPSSLESCCVLMGLKQVITDLPILLDAGSPFSPNAVVALNAPRGLLHFLNCFATPAQLARVADHSLKGSNERLN